MYKYYKNVVNCKCLILTKKQVIEGDQIATYWAAIYDDFFL